MWRLLTGARFQGFGRILRAWPKRADKLTNERRKEIAKKAAASRWKRD
jgi:hypothetical protein